MFKNTQLLITLLVVMLLNVLSNTTVAQPAIPFGIVQPVEMATQPQSMYHAGTDSTDAEVFTAVDGNGETFHYGWIDGANFSDGNVSIDSVSLVGQGSYVQNNVVSRTAVLYNSDTILYAHDNSFFNLGYPSSHDNNFGLLMQSTIRSNGSTFKFTAGITVRDENNFNLKKEYYLHDRSGQINNSSSVTLLDSNRIAIVTKGLTHTSSGYYLKLYDSVNVTGHAITGGTEISLANVPYFNYTQRAMIIIDMETDSVTGHILNDDYFTTKALGNGQYVDLLHHDTTITVNWYSENDTLIDSFVDDLPVYNGVSGANVSNLLPDFYSVINYEGNPSIATGRRGNTIYSLASGEIVLYTYSSIAFQGEWYRQYLVKDNYLYTVRADEMNFHIDVYDMNTGLNSFTRHYRNDVAFGSFVDDNLGTPDRFNMDVNGDLVTLSYSVEPSIDSYNTSIGNMESFPLYQNRIKSFSYQFTLPENPLETFEGFDIGFTAPEIEYIENDGYHQFTAFVSPGTDLSSLAINIDFGSGIEEYLFYKDKHYNTSSSIQSIVTGQNSDYTTYNGRILRVRNNPTTVEETYVLVVKYAPDSDENGISDFTEGINDSLDTDSDGTLDYLDLDNDNDGYSDIDELAEGGDADINNNDEDADGIINESHENDEDDDGSADAFDPENNIGLSELEIDVDIYSNNLTLYVESHLNLNVEVFDISGQQIGSGNGYNMQFQVQNTGIYFVRILSENIELVKKVFVN